MLMVCGMVVAGGPEALFSRAVLIAEVSIASSDPPLLRWAVHSPGDGGRRGCVVAVLLAENGFGCGQCPENMSACCRFPDNITGSFQADELPVDVFVDGGVAAVTAAGQGQVGKCSAELRGGLRDVSVPKCADDGCPQWISPTSAVAHLC